MANNVGNQGGFETMSKASSEMVDSSEIFKTSIGKFTAAVMTFRKAAGYLTGGEERGKTLLTTIGEVTGVLKDAAEIFSSAKLVDIAADATKSFYMAGKQLERNYGIIAGRSSIKSALRDISVENRQYGITLEDNVASLEALSKFYRNISAASPDLIATTSIISKQFGLSAEAGASLTYALTKMGGRDGEGAINVMQSVEDMAKSSGLSFELVRDNLEESHKSMFKLNLRGKDANSTFVNMVKTSTKMGISLDHMVKTAEKYRTIQGAIETSVSLGMGGLYINPMQLLAEGRGGDPTKLFSTVMNRLKGEFEGGQLTQTGIDMANLYGEVLGMDATQMQSALIAMKENGESAEDYYETMQSRMWAQQDILQRLESLFGTLAIALQPIVEPILLIAESLITAMTPAFVSLGKFLKKYEKVLTYIGYTLGAILTAILAKRTLGAIGGGIKTAIGWTIGAQPGALPSLLQSGMGAVGAIPGMISGMPGAISAKREDIAKTWAQTKNPWFDKGGIRHANRDKKGWAKVGRLTRVQRLLGAQGINTGLGAAAVSDGASEVGKAAGRSAGDVRTATGAVKGFSANAKQMAASAIPMIAFATSMVILAKAFQMFSDGVSWQGVIYGIGAMTAFTVAMSFVTSALATLSSSGVGWIGIALLLAMGGATMMLAKSFQWFADGAKTMIESLSNLGPALGGLATGLGAIMTIFGNPLFALGVGATFGRLVSIITDIGSVAERYVDPISVLSESLCVMADSLDRISRVNGETIRLNLEPLKGLEAQSINLAKNYAGVGSGEIVVNSYTDLVVDGKKLVRAQSKSTASVYEGLPG